MMQESLDVGLVEGDEAEVENAPTAGSVANRDPIEGYDSAAGLVPKGATPEQIMQFRRARAVAKRSILGDMAHACDAKARSIRAANPGRGKGTTSQIGERLAQVAKDIADMLWAEREKIGVPGKDAPHD